MRILTQIILALMLTVALLTYLFATWLLNEVRPRYLETMEESLVDTTFMLASTVSEDASEHGMPDALKTLDTNLRNLGKSEINARIYNLDKTKVDLRVYVTDIEGRLLYDSHRLDPAGADYSQWNDVLRTLKGKYGARSTRENEKNGRLRLYVAAPIKINGELSGVISVGKHSAGIDFFMRSFKHATISAAIILGICALALGSLMVFMVIRQLDKVTAYVKKIGTPEQLPPPSITTPEIKRLLNTFEEMRRKLEGRDYAKHYVQELTHAMKSPLSGLSGAAELLGTDMPPEKLHKLIKNISTESERLKSLVEKMLELSSLELCDTLSNSGTIDINEFLLEATNNFTVARKKKQVELQLEMTDKVSIEGDEFLLREAISSLIENAIEFSEEKSTITVKLSKLVNPQANSSFCIIQVIDNGSGIPPYAVDKVFDRFYSLPRPHTARKSTGLGLSFAQKIIQLHSGNITVENRSGNCGVCATIYLPC